MAPVPFDQEDPGDVTDVAERIAEYTGEEEPAAGRAGEAARVRAWRVECFQREGCVVALAETLADEPQVDLADFRVLRGRGCPAELAAGILR